jgi:hypothetical protein
MMTSSKSQGGYHMNKIKLLYDVARAMKAKEKVNGVLTARVLKDKDEVFSLRNEFGKNVTGEASAKVSCELNLNGSKVKRESLTEFSTQGDQRQGLLGRFFRHHRHHQHGECGIKGFFSRISFALGILSSLQAEEEENGTAVISLTLSEIPEELRGLLLEKINQRHGCHQHCGVLAEGDALGMLDGVVVLTVNKGREIEKFTVNLDGRVQNPESESYTLAASAEALFAW